MNISVFSDMTGPLIIQLFLIFAQWMKKRHRLPNTDCVNIDVAGNIDLNKKNFNWSL